MKQILLSLSVRSKKDLVLVRQRSRQIAALLGYGAQDQACLAGGVFALACQVHRRRGRTTWHFLVDNGHLRIGPDAAWAKGKGFLWIEKRLPEPLAHTGPDILWMTQQLSRLTPANIFREIQQLNQELLQALFEVRAKEGERTLRPAA